MNSTELALMNASGLGIDTSRLTPTNKVVIGTDQAANTECSDAVPTGKIWVLLSYTVNLVATVQAPLPNLVLTDGTNEFLSFPGASAASTAGVTSQFTWAPTLTLTAGAGLTRNYAPIPVGIILLAGFKLTTITAALGANCNYGTPRIYVREYA